MELLDRYLYSVKRWLPRTQSDDILAEISEDLRAQIEEEESNLGHKLDEAGMAALLVRRGHPVAVAARYMPQRNLIGPILFPHWLSMVRLIVFWILTPIFVFRVILAPVPIDSALVFRTLGGFIQAVWVALGVITTAFALFERSPGYSKFKVPDTWDPRLLPVYTPPTPWAREGPIIVSGILWAAVWVWFIRFHPVFHLSSGEISVTPALAALFWPFLVVVLASAALGFVTLIRKEPTRLLAGIRLAVSVAGLVVLAVLLRAGQLIEPGGPGSLASARGLEKGIHVTAIVCALLVAAHAVIEACVVFRGVGRAAQLRPPAANGQAAW